MKHSILDYQWKAPMTDQSRNSASPTERLEARRAVDLAIAKAIKVGAFPNPERDVSLASRIKSVGATGMADSGLDASNLDAVLDAISRITRRWRIDAACRRLDVKSTKGPR
jgi:hypothetical protein